MAPDGSVSYARFDYHRQAIESDKEALFVRFTGRGDSLKKGADLGALMMRGRVMDDEFELTERACNWITGIGEDGHGRLRAIDINDVSYMGVGHGGRFPRGSGKPYDAIWERRLPPPASLACGSLRPRPHRPAALRLENDTTRKLCLCRSRGAR